MIVPPDPPNVVADEESYVFDPPLPPFAVTEKVPPGPVHDTVVAAPAVPAVPPDPTFTVKDELLIYAFEIFQDADAPPPPPPPASPAGYGDTDIDPPVFIKT